MKNSCSLIILETCDAEKYNKNQIQVTAGIMHPQESSRFKG